MSIAALRRLLVVSAAVAALPACQAPPPVAADAGPGRAPLRVEIPIEGTPLLDALPPLPAGRSFLFPKAGPGQAPAEPPISLTASDGTGLKLVGVQARAVVAAPLAFTELLLTFDNPEPRVLEGRFQIALPDGASISRFAMKIGDAWQEGEVVEKQAARRAYEDFLHRRQDPALLESNGGNEFSARVFPIPANGRKQLLVSYSHELPEASSAYRIPLRGLPEIGVLDVKVALGEGPEAKSVGEVRHAFVPDRDFEVEVPREKGRLGLRHENLVVARVAVPVDAPPAELSSLVVLLDTSASRALGFDADVSRVDALVRALAAGAGADAKLVVAAFDQGVDVVFDGPAGRWSDAEVSRLRARRALGASDLAGALRFAATKPGLKRLLLVTDGIATAGDVEDDALLEAARRLADAGYARMDALMVGGIRDEAKLAKLVTTALPEAGVVVAAKEGLDVLAQKMTRACRSDLDVEVPGAAWWWPRTLKGVQPGDQVLVYADLPADAPLFVTIDGATFSAAEGSLRPAERPLLERAWVKARIDRLLDERDRLPREDVQGRAALQRAVVDLSTRHRVLSPFTSLLVLETEQDYQRFGIDRRALSDVLVVTSNGIEVKRRSEAAPRPTEQPPRSGDLARAATKAEPSWASTRDEGGGADAAPSGAADLDGPSSDGAIAANAAPGDAPAAEARPPATETASAAEPLQAPAAPSPAPPEEPAPHLAEADVEEEGKAEARPVDDDEPSAVAGRRPQTRAAGRRFDAPVAAPPPAPRPQAPAPTRAAAWSGPFAEVMHLLQAGRVDDALKRARAWQEEQRGDVLALVALGEALEKKRDWRAAARAYGSIIDLFPGRADLRRFAGGRLERIADDEARALAVDTYRKAAADRPDHPSSHRLLAFALLRAGGFAEAFEALERGLRQAYPQGRFAGADRILREDMGLVAAAWTRAEPALGKEIAQRVREAGGHFEGGPSLRFVLHWETDANDVDFHIHDGRRNHAYYGQPQLRSGGDLYADVTTGYGPECFAIRQPAAARAYPYRLEAHYYRRGPMGYGMGKLQVVEHDGAGGLSFLDRPFVVMQDGAYVDLGAVKGPLSP